MIRSIEALLKEWQEKAGSLRELNAFKKIHEEALHDFSEECSREFKAYGEANGAGSLTPEVRSIISGKYTRLKNAYNDWYADKIKDLKDKP